MITSLSHPPPSLSFLSFCLSPVTLSLSIQAVSICPTSHPSQSLGLNKACDVLSLSSISGCQHVWERICFKVFCSLEMVCLYSKYTALATLGFGVFVLIRTRVHVCFSVCVCALKTMTIVSEVLKDLGVHQLPGYQGPFYWVAVSMQTFGDTHVSHACKSSPVPGKHEWNAEHGSFTLPNLSGTKTE